MLHTPFCFLAVDTCTYRYTYNVRQKTGINSRGLCIYIQYKALREGKYGRPSQSSKISGKLKFYEGCEVWWTARESVLDVRLSREIWWPAALFAEHKVAFLCPPPIVSGRDNAVASGYDVLYTPVCTYSPSVEGSTAGRKLQKIVPYYQSRVASGSST